MPIYINIHCVLEVSKSLFKIQTFILYMGFPSADVFVFLLMLWLKSSAAPQCEFLFLYCIFLLVSQNMKASFLGIPKVDEKQWAERERVKKGESQS